LWVVCSMSRLSGLGKFKIIADRQFHGSHAAIGSLLLLLINVDKSWL
jgi:hypothetical protein